MQRLKAKKWFRKKFSSPKVTTISVNIEPSKYTAAYALFDYCAIESDELSIKQGDFIFVLMDIQEWWQATNKSTNKSGLVPFNYVTKETNFSNILPAWFKIDRSESERLLYMPGVESGCFVVRPSSDPNSIALSVKKSTDANVDVKHFKIFIDKQKGCFYVRKSVPFTNLNNLINYYHEYPVDSNTKLAKPCPQIINPPEGFVDCYIDRKLITCEQKLGEGYHGVVMLGKLKNLSVAIKMVNSNTYRSNFLTEAKVMHRLVHQHIVRFYGVCCEPRNAPVWLLMEYMENGNLRDYLHTLTDKILPKNHFVCMMDQVACGMVYLESQRIVHMDLRAANILVNKLGTLKIADFGLTQRIDKLSTSYIKSDKNFPIRWAAPELSINNCTISLKTDVWSFGVLMFEIATFGSLPYADMKIEDIIDNIKLGYHLPHPSTLSDKYKCDDVIYRIMVDCWNLNPDKRPKFDTVKSRIVQYIRKEVGFYVGHLNDDQFE